MISCKDDLMIPNYVTYKPLQGPHISSFDVQGHRFDRFSFKLTKLTCHIPQEVLPRFASRKAVRKVLMESSQFVGEIFYILRHHFEFRNAVRISLGPAFWQHSPPLFEFNAERDFILKSFEMQ